LVGSCRRKAFISVIVYVLLFGCLSTIAYAALAAEVREAFIELLSINQVGALGMGVSRM
jgi:hypothetical protein